MGREIGSKMSSATKAKIKKTKAKNKKDRPDSIIIDIDGYKVSGDSYSFTVVSPAGKRAYFEYVEGAMKYILQQKIKLVTSYKIDDLIDHMEEMTKKITDACEKFKVKK